MRTKKKRFLTISFLLILLAGIFYIFVSRPLFDFDFWWHISTGRYIVQHHSLPDHDPFSFTEELPENKNLFPERANFILKQYWLAQVILYLVYDNTGPRGIVFLRALILTAMILIVYSRLRKWGVNFHVSFIFIFFLLVVAARHIGERPVLFTILFTPAVFSILEGFKDGKKRMLLLLPPLMLFWSNLHGGFIIGDLIILVFMFGEGVKIFFKKINYTHRDVVFFYALTSAALLCSFLNPTGWDAFSIALSPEYKFMEQGIQEYASPIQIYKAKLWPSNFGIWALFFIFPVVLILRNRKMDLTHVLLLSGFFAMALQTGRYDIYYAVMSCMILGRETDMLLNDLFRKKMGQGAYAKMTFFFTGFAVLSGMLYFFGIFRADVFRYKLATDFSVPEGAVDFIERNRLSGNVMNDAGFGGYITWRLYPWKKTFVDTRWLNYTVKSEFSWVMGGTNSLSGHEIPKGKLPLWERLLDHYNINFTISVPLDVYGHFVEITPTLLQSKAWVPVYCDSISIIFVKNIPRMRI